MGKFADLLAQEPAPEPAAPIGIPQGKFTALLQEEPPVEPQETRVPLRQGQFTSLLTEEAPAPETESFRASLSARPLSPAASTGPSVVPPSTEPLPVEPPSVLGVFDPEGAGYDYAGAQKAGIAPDAAGHWASRDPNTGLLLKGRGHETWEKTIAAEEALGYRVFKKDGRWYSEPKSQLSENQRQRIEARLQRIGRQTTPPESAERPYTGLVRGVARLGTKFFVEPARGLAQTAAITPKIMAEGVKKVLGDNWWSRRVLANVAKLDQPTKIEQEISAESQERMNEHIRKGEWAQALGQGVTEGGLDFTTKLLQLMMLSKAVPGGISPIPGMAGTKVGPIASNALRLGMTEFITRPGTPTEKLKGALIATLGAMTPAVAGPAAGRAGVSPGAATALAKGLDFALNTAISTFVSRQYPDAYKAAKEASTVATGSDENWFRYFVANAAPVFIQDVVTSLGTEASRPQPGAPKPISTGAVTPPEAVKQVGGATTIPPAAKAAPEALSVGAAGAGELGTGEATGLRRSVAVPERRALGLPEEVQAVRRSLPEVAEEAAARIAQNPMAGPKLVEELKAAARPLTDTDVGVLTIEKVRRFNERNAAASESARMAESGTPEQQAEANARSEAANKSMEELFDVMARGDGKSITQTARGLRALQMMMDDQFSLVEMEQSVRQKQGNKPLTPEQHEQLKEIQAKYEETKAKLDEALGKTKATTEEAEPEIAGTTARTKFGTLVDDVAGGKPPRAPTEPAAPVEGDLASTVKQLYRAEVEAGVRDVDVATKNVHAIVAQANPELTPTKVRDLFSDYGKTKMPSQKEVSKVMSDFRRQAQLLSSIERVIKKLAPLKTGLQRDKPSQRARELQKQLNAMMKEAGIKVVDPATQLATSLAAIKTRLTNSIADLDKAIATKTKMVDTKTPTPYDAEAKALVERRDTLRKQYDAMFPKEPMTSEQRLQAAIKGAERNLVEWNKRLENAKAGKFGRPQQEGAPLPESKALADLKAQRDAVKSEIQQLKDLAFPKRTPEQIAIDAKRKRLEAATAEMRRRMREGDFTPKERKQIDISHDPEAVKALAENDKVKIEFGRMKEDARKSARTPWEVVKEATGNVAHTIKNVASSWDISAPGRQGWLYGLSHPIKWLKTYKPMFQSLSTERSMQLDVELNERPNARKGLYQKAGLGLSKGDGTGNFTQVEDAHRLDLAEKIPGVSASNRAYATFLNRIRADMFDHLLAMSKDPADVSTAKIKAIADGVNALTGRGTGLGRHAESLALVLWAPRFLKSGVDVLTLRPLRTGTPETRRMFAKEYGRILSSLAAIYSVAALFKRDEDEIELDPRSSRFGAITIGGKHTFNPIGYVRPTLTLMARMISGQTKTHTGVHKLREWGLPFAAEKERKEKVPYGTGVSTTLWRFLESKLHPAIGMAKDVLSGKTFEGEPITSAKQLAGHVAKGFTPLAPRQTPELYRTEDFDAASVLLILNTLGFTVDPDYGTGLDKVLEKTPNQFAVTRWINGLNASDYEKKRLKARAKEKMGW